jgi:hypothetical protein
MLAELHQLKAASTASTLHSQQRRNGSEQYTDVGSLTGDSPTAPARPHSPSRVAVYAKETRPHGHTNPCHGERPDDTDVGELAPAVCGPCTHSRGCVSMQVGPQRGRCARGMAGPHAPPKPEKPHPSLPTTTLSPPPCPGDPVTSSAFLYRPTPLSPLIRHSRHTAARPYKSMSMWRTTRGVHK